MIYLYFVGKTINRFT